MVQAPNNALVSRKPIPAFMTKQSAEIPKRPKFRVMSSVDELMSKFEVAGSRLGTQYSAGSAGRLFADFGANCERTFCFSTQPSPCSERIPMSHLAENGGERSVKHLKNRYRTAFRYYEAVGDIHRKFLRPTYASRIHAPQREARRGNEMR